MDKKIKQNKKIIIVSIIFIIILVFIIFMIANNNKETKNNQVEIAELDISQVLKIEDISNSKYEIEKKKNIEISSQYLIGAESYELNANVKLQDKIGKMYYIRESYNKINVYQTEYVVDEYEAISIQVNEIIQEFEESCKSFLGIGYEEKGTEELIGESTIKGKIPIGESIYYENREYAKTYNLEEKIYEMNFYRKDDKIICELVYEL